MITQSNKKQKIRFKKIIRNAVQNMNTNSQKYGYPPETVEKKYISNNIF